MPAGSLCTRSSRDSRQRHRCRSRRPRVCRPGSETSFATPGGSAAPTGLLVRGVAGACRQARDRRRRAAGAVEDREPADVRGPAVVVPQQQEQVRCGQPMRAGRCESTRLPSTSPTKCECKRLPHPMACCRKLSSSRRRPPMPRIAYRVGVRPSRARSYNAGMSLRRARSPDAPRMTRVWAAARCMPSHSASVGFPCRRSSCRPTWPTGCAPSPEPMPCQ